MQGTLRKLKSSLTEPVQYHLPVGEQLVDLNALIGKQLTLTFSGTILCSNCGKKNQKELLSRTLLCMYAQNLLVAICVS